MTTVHRPPAQRRTGPLDDRQWILLGTACVAAVLLLAAMAAVALRLNRADAHEVTGALGGRREARFEMASGVEAMTVRVSDLGDRLYRISTPTGRAPVPHVTDHDNVVQLRLTGGGGGSSVEVRLSSRVRWAVRVAVGLAQTTVNLTGGTVSAVEFAAGVGMADLTLPVPSGTVPVRIGAGANQFTVHLRPGVAAQVRVRSGVGNLTLDGTSRSGVSGGAVYPLGGYASARDRYDIDLATGVAALVVRRD
ncbi:MAG: hypothetical protein V7603_3236 [Micromonosporaceae bacterium]